MSKYYSFLFKLAYPLICVVMLMACGSSKKGFTEYAYFKDGSDTVISQQSDMLIQASDLLSIQVFSKTANQEQAAIFNMQNAANGVVQGYQVSLAGFIDMPVIGSIKAAGITKSQLQAQLAKMITDYVKNPSVLVRYLEFKVNVLGEVKSPGTQRFPGEKVTIIDAISGAGDLTDFGRRDNITVVREEGGKKIYRTIDLRSRDIFKSPVYHLRPNDIVYVNPTDTKLKTLSVDPEVQRKTTSFLTITSLIITVTTFVLTLLK